MSEHYLPIDTLLQGGQYRIVKVLGQGGFGITYLAQHRYFGEVALKELFLSSGTIICTRGNTKQEVVPRFDKEIFDTFKTRFLQEARKLFDLNDIPGVVNILDVFEENGTAYFSMKYLAGEKLDEYVYRKGRLSESEGVDLIQAIGTILAAVHKRNVLHRDIKPNNIIITHEGKVGLIDFGIARDFDSENTQIFYSPNYSPPEQRIVKSRMGAYSDIYSLGAVAYFVFTGIPPQSLEERTLGTAKSPNLIVPDLSNSIEAAITQSLRFKPEERFATVEAFLEALKTPIIRDKNPLIIQTLDDKEDKTKVFETPKPTEDKTKVFVAPKPTEDETKVFVAPKPTGDETKVFETPNKALSSAKSNNFKTYWLMPMAVMALIITVILFKMCPEPEVVKPKEEKKEDILVTTVPPVIAPKPEPSSDYKIAYELAKSTAETQKDGHHVAFAQLRKAAKIAIKDNEAESLLTDIGKDLTNKKDNALWRLSSGHQSDWEPIIKALTERDSNLLIEKHHH